MLVEWYFFPNKNPIIPDEDSYYIWEGVFCVADGITRDPEFPLDFTGYSLEACMDKYPNPSWAKLASDYFCKVLAQNLPNLSIKDSFIKGNNAVKSLNTKYIPCCDYLFNDYFSCVASAGKIEEKMLYYGYVGDCWISVFSKRWVKKFQSIDDVEIATPIFEKMTWNNWNKPKNRIVWRKEFRNNPHQIYCGKCVGFWAITWEEEMNYFLHYWKVKLETWDIVLFYSDGFSPIVQRSDFFTSTYQKSQREQSDYFNFLVNSWDRLYTKEKTLIYVEI